MTQSSTSPDLRRDGTVSRVLRLLSIFCEAGSPLGVHNIAQQSGLPISTVHRLVNLMAADGFVQHDAESRLYSPGPQLHRLTALMWTSGPAAVAQPILDAVSEKFDETVVLLLYLPDRLAISPIAKREGGRALRYVVDMNVPLELTRGASGKSILAHLDAATIRSAYDATDPTGVPLPSWDRFTAELDAIRERGYAVSAGERTPGAHSVAAVVTGALGEVVGTVCMTFPQDRLSAHTNEDIGAEISKAALELSRRLGAHE